MKEVPRFLSNKNPIYIYNPKIPKLKTPFPKHYNLSGMLAFKHQKRLTFVSKLILRTISKGSVLYLPISISVI